MSAASETKPRGVREDLAAMSGRPYRGARGVLVETNRRGETIYLCGVMYLWSGFAERAYELGEDDARELLARHPQELAGAVFQKREDA